MNESTCSLGGASPFSERELLFREVAPLLYQKTSRSARAKERADLTGESRFETLSRLAEKNRTAARPARPFPLVSEVLKYSHWSANQSKSIRDLEKCETQLTSEYVGRRGSPGHHRDSNRDAFLKSKEKLLANHFGKLVAFANGNFVAAADSFDSLAHQLAGRPDCLEVYVEFVEEAAFEAPAPEIISTPFEACPP